MFALAPAQAGGVQFAQAPPVAQPGQPGQPGQPRQGGPGGQGGQGGPGGRGGNPGFGGFGGFGGDGMAFIGDRPLRLDMAAVARWLLPAVAVETAPGKRVGIDPKACERTVRFAGNTLTVTMRVPLTGDAAEAKSLLVGVVDPGDKTANVPFALANVPLGAK